MRESSLFNQIKHAKPIIVSLNRPQIRSNVENFDMEGVPKFRLEVILIKNTSIKKKMIFLLIHKVYSEGLCMK